LVDDDGRAIYPNAQLVMHEAEAAFWLESRRSERRRRAHPPQYRQGARDDRTLS